MSSHTQVADVIVLGAGAAGMFCAFEAGRQGRRVLLLDHGEHPGRKILISGGGRCNFTNLGTRGEHFVSENPHFAHSALAAFTPADMVALVEKHGIRHHEKTLGQLFCDESARRIVTLLEGECGEAGVTTRCGTRLLRVAALPAPHAGAGSAAAPRFAVETGAGMFQCRTLVVATGGLSIPKMGATGFGYELARQFGHRIVDPRPALVPLVLGPETLADWADLAGVSTEVIAQAAPLSTMSPKANTTSGKAEKGGEKRSSFRGARSRGSAVSSPPCFREKLLLTHRGLSGPAILQVSSYWQSGSDIQIDLAPGLQIAGPLKAKSSGRDRGALLAGLKRVLPARFAERWVDIHLRHSPDWSNAGLDRTEAALHAWQLRPGGTEGFAKAEVTAGGVDTSELNARTMESRRVPGLHFIGEVVDVTGWLGGYNFQWAWASAAACGRSL